MSLDEQNIEIEYDDYFKEFSESMALKLAKTDNGIYKNQLFNTMMKNLSNKVNTKNDNLTFMQSILIKNGLKFDMSVNYGGGGINNIETNKPISKDINTPIKDEIIESNETINEVDNKRISKLKSIDTKVINNLRELNLFKNNINKINGEFENITNVDSKKYINHTKQLDKNFNMFKDKTIKLKNRFNERNKELNSKHKNFKKDLMKDEKSEFESFLKVNSKSRFKDGIEKEFFIDKLSKATNKKESVTIERKLKKLEKIENGFKDEIVDNIVLFNKTELNLLEAFKSTINKSFKDTYNIDLFNSNKENGIDIIKKNIKMSDVKEVSEAFKRGLHKIDRQSIDQDKIDTLNNNGVTLAYSNFLTKQFEEWRAKNKTSLELPKTIVEKFRKNMEKSYLLNIKDKDVLSEMKPRVEIQVEKIIDKAINGFKANDKTFKEFKTLNDENLRLKKELEELKKSKNIEIVIEKDNKVIDKFEVSKDEKIEIKNEVLETLKPKIIEKMNNLKTLEIVKRKTLLEKYKNSKLKEIKPITNEINKPINTPINKPISKPINTPKKIDNNTNTLNIAIETQKLNSRKKIINKCIKFISNESGFEEVENFMNIVKKQNSNSDYKNPINNIYISLSTETMGDFKTFKNKGNIFLDLKDVVENNKDIEKLEETKIEDIFISDGDTFESLSKTKNNNHRNRH